VAGRSTGQDLGWSPRWLYLQPTDSGVGLPHAAPEPLRRPPPQPEVTHQTQRFREALGQQHVLLLSD